MADRSNNCLSRSSVLTFCDGKFVRLWQVYGATAFSGHNTDQIAGFPMRGLEPFDLIRIESECNGAIFSMQFQHLVFQDTILMRASYLEDIQVGFVDIYQLQVLIGADVLDLAFERGYDYAFFGLGDLVVVSVGGVKPHIDHNTDQRNCQCRDIEESR